MRAENPTLLSTNQLTSMRYPLPGLPGETTLNIDTDPFLNAGFSAIFWLPHRLKRWTDKGVPTKPPCPTCGFHANVRSNGWTRGRRVFGVAHGIWLITERWVCGKCKKRQAECTEKLREGAALSLLAPALTMRIPTSGTPHLQQPRRARPFVTRFGQCRVHSH